MIFDVDVIGGLNLKKQFQDQAYAVFVKPPSYEELEKRLRGRSTETEEKINQRMEKATKELAFATEFDTILVNDDLTEACQKAERFGSRISSKMKIGLFFGSFNPVHVGHLIIADHVANHTDVDEVWMVVSPQNPLKEKKTLLADHHRLALVKEAVENNHKLRASDIEFKLPIPSYTVENTCTFKRTIS